MTAINTYVRNLFADSRRPDFNGCINLTADKPVSFSPDEFEGREFRWRCPIVLNTTPPSSVSFMHICRLPAKAERVGINAAKWVERSSVHEASSSKYENKLTRFSPVSLVSLLSSPAITPAAGSRSRVQNVFRQAYSERSSLACHTRYELPLSLFTCKRTILLFSTAAGGRP